MKIKLSQKILARELKFFEKAIEKCYFSKKKKIFSVIRKNSKVLEIGPGTGVNFKYYPKGISLSVVEPNSLFENDLNNKAEKFRFNFGYNFGFSEKLPFKNESFDFVVSTLVLCSVKNLATSLKEIYRVLKNNGTFIFIEHVVDKNDIFRKVVQEVAFYSPWRFFGDGCEPNRDIEEAIREVFHKVQIKNYYQENLGILGYVVRSHIIGRAIK